MHFLHSCSLYISLSSSSPDARQSRAPFSFVGDQFIFFSRPLYDSETILRGKLVGLGVKEFKKVAWNIASQHSDPVPILYYFY